MTATDDFDYRSELIESYDKYVLDAKQDSVGAPIFITAVLEDNERVGNVLNDPEDAKFNLSPYMGVNDKGHLFWDATGGQFAGRLNNPRVEQKYINNAIANVITVAIGVDPKKGEDRQWLQLDGRLDIIEDYDVVSRQFKIRLGLKPDSSKRSIVLCFDGTSNRFSNQNTNVIKLVELLKKNDPSEQMVYYQAGVGTYSHPGFLTGLGSKIARIADEAFAWYLYQHVIDGYKYLMETYQAGDQISIFGFSRGAYTARALAGMLHSVGLLPRHNIEQVPFAYQVYEASQKSSAKMADKNEPRSAAPISFETEKYLIGAMSLEQNDNQERHSVDMSARPENVDPKCFKMVFCTPIEIKFLGVWDTVGSVGAFKRKTLPHIEYNASVKHFRQALALDETRGNFIPSVWDHSKTQLEQGGQSAVEVWFKGGHSDVGGGAPLHSSDRKSPLFERLRPSYDRFSELSLSIAKKIRCLRRPTDPRQLEPETFAGDLDPPSPTSTIVTDPLSLMPPPPLNLDSDDPPKRLPDLSNISFRWMINQCLSLPDVRVLFDPYAMHCYRRAKIIEERPSGERSMERTQENRIKLDSFDITPKPYRVITKALWWWILEIAFIPKLAQRGSNRSQPETVYCPNLGTARLVNSSHDKDQIRLHYSAYGEINKGSGYQPIAEWYSEDKKVHIEDAPTSSAESKSQSIFDIVEMGWKPSLYQTHIRELTKSFLGRIVLHASVAGLLWLFVASTKVSILSIRHLLSGPASPKALLQRVSTFRNWAFHYFRGQNYYVGLTTHNGP